MLESAAVSVDEDFLVDFLQCMISTEHLRKDTFRAQCKNLSLCHHVMGSADIQSHHVRIKFDEICYFLLFFFELLPLSDDQGFLGLEVYFHTFVPRKHVLVVCDQLFPDSFEFVSNGTEFIIDLIQINDSASPQSSDLRNLAHVFDVQRVRPIDLKIHLIKLSSFS